MIGSGAYGEVWLACSVTGTYRAVKVVWREDFEDEAMFLREFDGVYAYEPIARDIPGLVHILHIGRYQGEFPYYYYVMELADDAYTGPHIDPSEYVPHTLHSDMKLYGNRPMPLDYVLEVGCQLAQALDGLHAHDLTHRDVKPANVVFVNGRAKLADAGLVASGEQRSFVGTEGYIPPEGGGTPRADVFALAKVLYEMATGKDRLDFPELPRELPEGASRRRWLEFNNLICSAAAPQVEKGGIMTAQELAAGLDALRTYHLRKKQGARDSMSGNRRLGRWGWPLLFAGVTYGGWLVVPEGAWQRIPEALMVLRGQGAVVQDAEKKKQAELFIGSVPSGASIYTASGEYVDETPYGPVDVVPGENLSFVIRKEGFADQRVGGIVPRQGLLSLGGKLAPYRPPLAGKAWKDVLGAAYAPRQDTHLAEEPVGYGQFLQFLRETPLLAGRFPHEEEEKSGFLLTTQEGIGAYILWLTRQCEQAGILGRDHSLIAHIEPGTGRGADMCAYRLSVVKVQKAPISIYTNPAGATVTLNGLPLGVTPMQSVRIPLAPYYLEVRMPGYTTVRRSGLSPKNLYLNLVLQPNHSVTFGAEWTNSLGMKMLPVGANLMACRTEVRVSDFRTFCEATGRMEPPRPGFEQNEHHPIVNVTRGDAEEFAHWLTQRERQSGLIEEGDTYRLPTDAEWSALVGLKQETGSTPYERNQHVFHTAVEYPWGVNWPPGRGAGNFADVSRVPYTRGNHSIPRYQDSFPFTAPVGSFAPNALGLHDLAGNVQEWVSGEYGGPEQFPFRCYGVTRGGDFTSFRPGQLCSGSRTPHPPNIRNHTIGFRLVLEHRPRVF